MKPLAIDMYAGLGGWAEGLLAEGYDVIGFDIERHVYGEHRYPAQLVLQDVLTLHGSQFRDASLIVASPPCQEYSYMAMPWSRAKQIAAEYKTGVRDRAKLTALFDACFRIQREAIEAAGHFIPLIVENVRGACPWVGQSRWSYGSFHLWGDVPALMPMTRVIRKTNPDRKDAIRGAVGSWFRTDAERATKNTGGSWFNIAHNTTSGCGQNPDGRKTVGHVNKRDGYGHTRHLTNQRESDKARAGVEQTGIKQGGDWFNDKEPSISRRTGSKSKARKAASAMIAKIPYPLSLYIARTFKPEIA